MDYLITGGEDNKLKLWELSPSRKTFEERTFLPVEEKFSVAMIHNNKIYIGTQTGKFLMYMFNEDDNTFE